jgi:acyl-CoA thioester hydrolase
MIKAETKIRVRYGETDQMGYAYYGIYAQYYEVGRVEAMRMMGFSYKDVEARGILMPVREFNISYRKPAFYDDEITVITFIKHLPSGFRFPFEYECRNSAGELINTGKVTLVCIDRSTNKMCRLPDWLTTAMAQFFRN